MNQLKHFDFKGNDVRTIVIDDQAWWVLKDVCEVLELRSADVRQRLSDDVVSTHHIPDSIGRMQDMTIINEDGLYDVMLESRKPEARAFRKWITSDVLPQIRKTGSYGADRLPRNYKEALHALIENVELTEKLQLEAEANKPKVALYDTAMSAGNNMPVGSIAKSLNVGRNKLFALLRERKILRSNNEPYQRFIDQGYFNVRQYTVTHLTQGLENKTQTMVTPKGMSYIHKILNDAG